MYIEPNEVLDIKHHHYCNHAFVHKIYSLGLHLSPQTNSQEQIKPHQTNRHAHPEQKHITMHFQHM